VVARERGGEEVELAVTGQAVWPLEWYWRHLDVTWTQPLSSQRPLVAVCDPEQVSAFGAALGPDYRRQRLPLRAWWLMYDPSPDLSGFIRYLFTRKPWGRIGSTDVVVFRRSDPASPSGEDLPAAVEPQ
jgi:hypothetical protein